MSALVTCKSKMTKKKFVVAALEQLEIAKNFIKEQPNDGVSVDRSYFRGYRDITFTKPQDGTYTIKFDSDDRRKIAAKVGVKDFQKSVHQWYDALVVKDTLTDQGFFPIIQKEGEKLRVVAQG